MTLESKIPKSKIQNANDPAERARAGGRGD